MPDQNVGITGHGGVYAVTGHLIAQQTIGCVRGDTAYHVAGINVFQRHFHTFFSEVIAYLFLEAHTNIAIVAISRLILAVPILATDMLARSLGHGDDCVLSLCDAFLKCWQQAVRSIQTKLDLGYQTEIDLLTRKGGPGGDEPGIAAHKLDQPNAVRTSFRFDIVRSKGRSVPAPKQSQSRTCEKHT